METATLNWVIITIVLYTAMFILVPLKKVAELSPFGFYLGLIQAAFLLWLGQSYLRFFLLVGDPVLFGIPLLSTVSWIPPTIIFAYYSPLADSPVKKIAYVLFFATGAVFVQYSMALMGLWKSLRWNLLYTFILAIFTHTLMTVILLYKRGKLGIKR